MSKNEFNIRLKSLLGDRAKRMLARVMYFSRNDYILFNVSDRAVKDRVNLDYWSESENLGDLLSPIVVNYMLERRGLSDQVRVSGKKHLYAVGSILTAGQQDATVWGSGILNCGILYRLKNRALDIRAVRGPLTRLVLMDYGYQVPEIYGDPAIIMPEIYSPARKQKKYKYGLVLHKDYQFDGSVPGDTLMLNIRTGDYKTFIDRMSEVETVISSSLHGIILAEAYGIGAILLKPQVDLFKYYDYYYSTDRTGFPIAGTVEEALDLVPPSLPDLSRIREQIINAFPFDLYSGGERS